VRSWDAVGTVKAVGPDITLGQDGRRGRLCGEHHATGIDEMGNELGADHNVDHFGDMPKRP